ncbi:hypothetical protein E2C01_067521 [Portunus trituberculatus]|uniref:Uncharacterized protein n=1 Tax=Portunus trituberculatus TaxID=210409 RepID=A0A5B7HL86_PORTR|nr:hypothetical protein [Portunus trituberculatus]
MECAEEGEHIALVQWSSNFLLDFSVIPINLTQRFHANIIGQVCDSAVVLPPSNKYAITDCRGGKPSLFSLAVHTYQHPYWDLKYSAKPMLVK